MISPSSPFPTSVYPPATYQNIWPASNAQLQAQSGAPANAVAQPAAQQRPVYNWAAPSQWVNSARTLGGNVRDELQKKFPGEYAHLIGWQPVKSAQMNLKESAHVLNQVAHHRPVKDNELITFDDDMKRAASLGIATLATLGLKQGVFGVGEYLGMASWFGAMAATPKLINTMVRAKTGVNLNQKYDSTEGQRLNLYQDPNYQPLHLLTKEQEDLAAKKLHVPDGPNRRREIENKIRQVSVQAHTWGMLSAGIATPVISGLACDLLQDPAMQGINRLKETVHKMEANRLGNAKYLDAEKLTKRTERYLNQVIGEVPESELSSWWKQFGKGVVKNAGLDGMDITLITKGSRIKQREELVNRLAQLAQPDNKGLARVKTFLDKQFVKKEENGEDVFSGRICKIEQKADTFLNAFKETLDPKVVKAEQERVQARIINAKSTIRHYRDLCETIESTRKNSGGKPLSEDALTSLKEKLSGKIGAPTTKRVQSLMTEGRLDEAEKLVGDRDTFNLITKNLANEVRKGETAEKLMGATPEGHLLDDALKSLKLGRMWRTRTGLFLGGSVLAATAIYNFTMVGRDFKKPTQKTPPTQPPNGGPV